MTLSSFPVFSSLSVLSALSVLAITACDPAPSDTGAETGPAAAELQLEGGSVTSEACPDTYSCDATDIATGPLEVTRTAMDPAADLAITVDGVAFSVHSPTGVDLAEFVGSEVTASMRGEWMVPISFELHDTDGPVYVLETGRGNVFSVVPADFGEDLGFIIDGDYKLTFHAIDVSTDDGVVSVKPGDVVTIHVGGASYRFAAIASYTAGEIPGGEYADCGGRLSVLSYELLRIPADSTFSSIKRPDTATMARHSGCGG
jgi:hypothetical protein